MFIKTFSLKASSSNLSLLLQQRQHSSNPMAFAQQQFLPVQRASPPPASVASDGSASNNNVQNTLQQLMAQSTATGGGGDRPQISASVSQQMDLMNQQLLSAVGGNSGSSSSQTIQPNNTIQMQVLRQVIAAQQQASRNQADSNNGRDGSVGSTTNDHSAALLQFLSPTWNQMNDSATFVRPQMSTLQQPSAASNNVTVGAAAESPSRGNRCSNVATASARSSNVMKMPSTTKPKGSRNTNVPSAPTLTVPPRVAARNQQVQLMESFRAASSTSGGGSSLDGDPRHHHQQYNIIGRHVRLEELKYALPEDVFDNRTPDGRAINLPILLVMPNDHTQLSAHQTLLRYQIEVFRANDVDAGTHQRGRNKPIRVGQVGFRCRHCKHLTISDRPRGSSYFPSEVKGVYQAAQNMNTTHFQHGVCTEMGEPLRYQFATLSNTKATSTGAGRAYWAQQATALGLEDNREQGGIRFWRDGKKT
jgi:hypothetical protein